MYFYVYLTTCKVNSKIYVGKAKVRPYHEKYYGSGIILENAIKKYGVENFTKEILEGFDSEEECFEAERFYIEALHARDPKIGYNIASGGPGGRAAGKRMTVEEAKAVHKSWGSREHRELVSQNSLRYWADIGAEERHSRASKTWTPDRRAARSKMLADRLADPVEGEAYRKKLSEAVRAANEKAEIQAKRKAAMNDPDLKARLKESRLNQARDPKQIRLNKEVRQPLAVITRLLNSGKITEDEAQVRRQTLYTKREEIMNGNDA